VCGIMAGGRLDDIDDHVFATSSRINSTFGGSLVDMVRATVMLEVIERDRLMARAANLGEHLLAGLVEIQQRHEVVTGARGRGLMCALDLPDPTIRDAVTSRMFTHEHVFLLGCGTRTVRFRPTLTVTEDELDTGLAALERTVRTVAG
jgi:L-lysine 6-transaminase